MADSFFGFDTSLSNLNDDEGGGEPSEDEYDALNDETFGQGSDEFDWEHEHEQLAEQLESSRRHNSGIDDAANTQLEASLSQLVLDETDSPHSIHFGSSVWRRDPITTTGFFSQPATTPLKNVCTVEELERQLRQKQQQPTFNNQSYFQPRFPPVILQRPPGLQAPVPLPFAPQQPMNHGMNQPMNQMNQSMNQMNQPLNKLMNQMGNTQMMQNHVNQIGQNNPFNQFQNQMGMNQSNIMNQLSQNMGVHQMGQNQNLNLSQSMGQLGQNLNQMGSNVNPIGQNMNQMNQNHSQIVQSHSQMSQNVNQMGQNMNQMGQNVNQMGQNMNQMGPNINQMGPNSNQMNQNVNQMGQNMNQMMPNGNQFPPGINQYQHMMGQPPRMMGPPPGMNMPRQNFNNPNMGQFNPNFRPQSLPMKPENQLNQPNLMSQPILIKNQPTNNMKLQSPSNTSQSPQTKQHQQHQQQQHQQQQQQQQKLLAKDQKLQKSRVYNNSKQSVTSQNMTSQNLVQLIQNTHPMLQFNNSFHNANHHPILNNRGSGNMFNNGQFGHPMFNQRPNGTFNRNSMNGDDGNGSDTDEYAGLMTQREKQWLINIQMLQLNTGTPYIHDFYYTVFLERQANKEKEGIKEAHKANQQNHPFYSGGVKQESSSQRERHNSVRHNSTSEDGAAPRTYVPTQFENSLGKLQCGSVTAPRKIIDVEVVGNESAPSRMSRASSVASTTHPQEVPREIKRTKQLLLDIEALYLILLRLEELNDPLAISNALILKEREEKQKQLEAAQKEAENEQQDVSNLFLKNIESVQRRPKQDSPKSENIDKRQVVNLAVNQKPAPIKNLLDEDKEELVNKMFAGLLHSDRLQQMLSVRKGRTLVCRFVSRVGRTHSRLRPLWARVLRAVPGAARRDAPGLNALAPHYRSYIQNTVGWSPILESCSLLAEAFDPARTPYALTTSLTLSCVCALIEKASLLVNTPEATSNERQYSKFLKTLARALKNTTLNVARPTHPIQEQKLSYHMKQLDSRATIEILQRGKTADFTELTKTEVTEQLLKYLC